MAKKKATKTDPAKKAKNQKLPNELYVYSPSQGEDGDWEAVAPGTEVFGDGDVIVVYAPVRVIRIEKTTKETVI